LLIEGWGVVQTIWAHELIARKFFNSLRKPTVSWTCSITARATIVSKVSPFKSSRLSEKLYLGNFCLAILIDSSSISNPKY